MIGARSVLAIIPARGGSKGVPRKNLRQVGGRPLLAWTVAAARASRYIDRLVISSEDAEIIACAAGLGCEAPFVRPAALARDDTPGIAPVLHALELLPGYDYMVLLQPTSPLRTAADIDGCIERCNSAAAPACVSVTPATQNPYWMYTLDRNGKLSSLLGGEAPPRRQALPEVYRLNGAVYVAESAWLAGTGSFLGPDTLAWPMPEERSLDIDSELDLLVCNALLEQRDHA